MVGVQCDYQGEQLFLAGVYEVKVRFHVGVVGVQLIVEDVHVKIGRMVVMILAQLDLMDVRVVKVVFVVVLLVVVGVQ